MDGSRTGNENKDMIYDNNNMGGGKGKSMQPGVEYDTVTRYVVSNPHAYVCVSSHLQQGQERQSLLAQEKLGAEVSRLARSRTTA